MSATIQPAYASGELVTQAKAQLTQDAARNEVGSALALILGINSANSMDSPFTCTATGGMSVTAGGSGGQKILANSASGPRLVDALPSQSFAVPTADGSNARRDMIYGNYTQAPVLSSSSGQFATLSGSTITTSTGNTYNALEALTYTYVTGTASSSPTDPTGPANSVALVRITVPASTASISSGNIQVLLTSAQSQILSGVAGYVDLTSNQSIAGNKIFTGQSTLSGLRIGSTPSGAGLTLNTSGSVTLDSSGSGSIYLGYNSLSLGEIVFGPGGTWGHVTARGYGSPSGTAIYGDGTLIGNGTLHVGGSGSIVSSTAGDGVFERGGTSGVVFLGNSGSAYLYYTGSSYIFGAGPFGASPVNVNGIVIATNGFGIPNQGSQTVNGFTFGNATTSGAETGIGSRGIPVNGVSPSVLNIENVNTSQLVALDSSGNLGVAGGIFSAYSQTNGNAFITGNILANGTGTFVGNLFSQGVRIPTNYTSSDGSVIPVNSGGTLTINLPSGFANAFSSDGSVNVGQSGRTVVFSLPGNFVNSITSPTGTVSVNASGRSATVDVKTGLSYRGQARISAGASSQTLILPNLPAVDGHSYVLYAQATVDLASGSMTLSGANASWEGAQTISDDGVSGQQIIELIGTVASGSPQVTVNIPNFGGGGRGILAITAWLQ